MTLSSFGGLDTVEIAEVLKLSARTVDREWRFQTIVVRTRFFTPYESGWAEAPFAHPR